MRSVRFVGLLAVTTLGACGSDAADGVRPFESPWGNPGSRSVVCGPGTYLAGQECRAGEDPDALDAGAPLDAEHDGGGLAGGGDGNALDAGRDHDAGPNSDEAIDVATACLVDDNKIVITGDGYLHPDAPLVIEGGASWYVRSFPWLRVDGIPSYLDMGYDPQRPKFTDWELTLSTEALGTGLAKGAYSNAQCAGLEDPGHPGFELVVGGGDCGEVSGKFTIVDIQFERAEADADSGDAGTQDGGAPVLKSLTVTFEYHCDGDSRATVGCVHLAGSWALL